MKTSCCPTLVRRWVRPTFNPSGLKIDFGRFLRPILGRFLPIVLVGAMQASSAPPPVAHPENALFDGPPSVATWVPPVYPPDALKEKVGGMVMGRIIVDDTGRVIAARALKTPDARLGEAAVAALRRWTFTPARDNQRAVAMCLDVPLRFDPKKGAESWPAASLPPLDVVLHMGAPRRTAATGKSGPVGDYPETLKSRRLQGTVTVACRVDAAGRASAPRILAATHADFVLPALASFAQWQFTPAMQGDLPVAAELSVEITYDPLPVDHDAQLVASGLSAPDGTPPANPPNLRTVVDPVWPYDLLMKGEDGSASAEFTVEADGSVTAIKVREASQPEFGRALAAALEGCTFQPAYHEGKGVAMTLLKRAEFKAAAPGGGEESGDPVARLVQLARAGGLHGGGRLDEPLTPLYQATPDYPAALQAGEKPVGAAVIEMVIDRDGRARLPRIVSASREEFGWAAATAAAQWVFKAPRRDGQPTEVKVQIPFRFAAPAQ